MDQQEREKINKFDNSPEMQKVAMQKHCDELRARYFQSLQVAEDYKHNQEPMLERQARKAAEELRREYEEKCGKFPEE